MPINVSNTTQSLDAVLKDVQRLEAPEAKKKEKDTPAQSVAKAVAVSISSDAKMQILKDTLTQILKTRGESYTYGPCIFFIINANAVYCRTLFVGL